MALRSGQVLAFGYRQRYSFANLPWTGTYGGQVEQTVYAHSVRGSAWATGAGCSTACGWSLDLASFKSASHWHSASHSKQSSFQRLGLQLSPSCGLHSSTFLPAAFSKMTFGDPRIRMSGQTWHQPGSFDSQRRTSSADRWKGQFSSSFKWHTTWTHWSGSGPLAPTTFWP